MFDIHEIIILVMKLRFFAASKRHFLHPAHTHSLTHSLTQTHTHTHTHTHRERERGTHTYVNIPTCSLRPTDTHMPTDTRRNT